jgi:hypothetical protein
MAALLLVWVNGFSLASKYELGVMATRSSRQAAVAEAAAAAATRPGLQP